MSGLPINERVLIRASAGTGKTYQLTNRYISRLLHDVPPSEMLAVTFTRNAAAEILDRVLVRLARAADDPDETRQLAEATGETDLEPGRCRQVLAGVIDSLQQLRISTLDSYFNRVASSFSLELELPVPWRMIDDIETGQLKREAIRRVVHRGDQTVLRQLVNLLSGSDATRSVEDTLLNVVTDLHRTFRETSRNEDSARAWKWLDRPKRPGRSEIDQAVAVMQNAALPEGSSWNKAHQKAIADVDAMAWEDLVKRGLGLKIVTGTVDESKVPPEVIAAYQHAFGVLRADVSNRLADQTAAIYDVLEMFDAEFTGLKHELRCVEFEDITQQLSVTALREDSQRLAHRLNADVDHLLLDEFQDTSPLQWQVISPLAREITGGNAQDRSFFCVGDRKQAIYGWRGGVAEILEELESELDGLTGKGQDLSESFRSTPEVILTINEVFGNRTRHDNLDQITDAVAGWTFAPHEAHHTNRVGYACLKTLPGERSKVDDEAKFDEIAAIIEASADYDVGILVRKNETVSEVVAQLRQREIPASQEGGFPLTDSAPVLTLLSMTRLADHPGDSIAGFHVASSPLGEILGLDRSATETDFSEVSRRLREDLIDRGYGAVIGDYARQLAEVSDEDERFRLSQLVRLASRYDARSTLRPAAFDRFIRSEGDGNPSADRVRVMNIHQAKGLEFDVVILPELNSSLTGRTNMLSARRPDPTRPPDRILKTASKKLRQVFREDKDINQIYVAEQSRSATEALCVLYVAMTRARYALHMLIPPSNKTENELPATTAGLLRAALTNGDAVEAGVLLFEEGDPQWWSRNQQNTEQAAEPVTEDISLDITLEPCGNSRRRGRRRRAPSDLEGHSEVAVSEIFTAGSGENMRHGTLIHAWLEHTRWADQIPDDQALETIAHRNQIHVADLDDRIALLKKHLRQPEILSLLSEDSYHKREWLPFSDTVCQQILDGDELQIEVRCEYPFTINRDGETLNGTIDRLVLLRQGDAIVAADTIDYKTDHVEGQDAVDEKVEYYRGQLEAYRNAVRQVFGLDDDHIATRLAFLGAGQLADV